MSQIKISREQRKKLAEQVQFDREQAFELGFAKAAHDLGISDEAQYRNLYQLGCQKMAAQRQKS